MNIRSKLRAVYRRIRPRNPKPLILMYHRIADDPLDHFEMTVSPVHFGEQLEVLRRRRSLLPLGDFVSHLITGTLPPDAVALTFDDGYVDNLYAAKPRLAVADISATVFLITGYLDSLEPPWFDELTHLVFSENCAPKLDIEIGDEILHFDFGAQSASADLSGFPENVASKTRREALWRLWLILRTLDKDDRNAIMDKLRSHFKPDRSWENLGRIMTKDEVRMLVSDGLIEIGAHSVTHPVLKGLSSARSRLEIFDSKITCEELIGKPIGGFAYPYGDFDADTCDIVKAARFEYACSTRQAPIDATSDVWALPRIRIRNCDGDAFERALWSVSAMA